MGARGRARARVVVPATSHCCLHAQAAIMVLISKRRGPILRFRSPRLGCFVMSGRVARALLRRSGITDFARKRFVQEVLVPFVTFGQISLEEARYLAELAQQARGTQPIIEIGTLFGSSTKVLLLNKDHDQPMVAVDLFSWNPAQLTSEQHYMVTTMGLRAFAGEAAGLTIQRQDKNEFYQSYLGPPPALVFLDAIHTYGETRKDIEWARSVGASIICGHDYGGEWPGVVRAVEEAGGAEEVCGTLWRLKG